MKKIISMVMAVIMTTTLCMGAVSAASTPTGVNKNEITAAQISAVGIVRINGVALVEDDNMGHFWIDAAGRTQAPVRLLVENMGYSITYSNGVVTVPSGPNGDLVITIGDKNLKVGGSTVAMDTMAVTINGRTYVPLRFVAEALGATVSTEKWPDIDIATTFTPERTINGVADMSWDKCVNVQKFIEENKSDIYWPTSDKLRLNYLYDGTEMKMDVINLTNAYQIIGIGVGSYADKQFELLYALVDDVVEENSRQAVKDMLAECASTVGKDYSPVSGISAEGMAWVKEMNGKTVRYGNVNCAWSLSGRATLVISTATD